MFMVRQHSFWYLACVGSIWELARIRGSSLGVPLTRIIACRSLAGLLWEVEERLHPPGTSSPVSCLLLLLLLSLLLSYIYIYIYMVTPPPLPKKNIYLYIYIYIKFNLQPYRVPKLKPRSFTLKARDPAQTLYLSLTPCFPRRLYRPEVLR